MICNIWLILFTGTSFVILNCATNIDLQDRKYLKNNENRREFIQIKHKARKGVFYYRNGDKYEGGWKFGKRNGFGTLYYNNGEMYTGGWKFDKKSGKGVYHYRNGDVYEGEWRDDKKHGIGTYRWKNGNRYDGEWKNSKKHGNGTYHFSKNRYVGEWKDDEKDGKGSIYYSNGEKYEGEWKHNFENGKGIYYYENNRKLMLEWKKDSSNQRIVIYNTEDYTFEGEWKRGRKNGRGILTWFDNDTFVGNFRDDIRYGKGIFYSRSGEKYESEIMRIVNGEETKFEAMEKLINETMKIESDNINSLFHLMRKDLEYALNHTNMDMKDERHAFNYILITLMTTESRKSSKKESIFVIDIRNYVTSIQKEINEFKSDKWRYETRQNYKEKKEKIIDNCFKSLVELFNDIKSDEAQVQKNIDELKLETLEMSQSQVYRHEGLIEQRKKLESKLNTKMIFSVLKLISKGLYFLGSKFVVIGETINVATSISEKVNESLDTKSMKNFNGWKYKNKVIKRFAKVKGAEVLSEMVSIVKDFFKERNEIKLKLEETKELIVEIHRSNNDLDKKYAQINDLNNEILGMTEASINQLTESKSHIELHIDEFRIKENLNSLKLKVSKLLGLYSDSKDELLTTITRLENSISAIIYVHQYILSIRENLETISLLYDITSPKQSSDRKNLYYSQLVRLESKNLENMVKERYELALRAFKYWSFPFYCLDKQSYNIIEDFKNIENFTYIDEMSKELEKIIKNVEDDSNSIRRRDNHIRNKNFNLEFPFFKWTYKNFKYEIDRLFERNILKTILYADVKSSSKNAIKFSLVNILIEAHSSPGKNQSLNRILGNFDVHLKYIGDAHYLYNSIEYVIKTNNILNEVLELSYHYGCEECFDSNETIKKLKGRALLSPYTLWELELVFRENLRNAKEHILNELEDLLNNDFSDITITLYGKGSFVDNRIGTFSMDCYL